MLVDCKSCGRNIIKYTCYLCGTGVCGSCYNIKTGLCINCSKGKNIMYKNFVGAISEKVPAAIKSGKQRYEFGELLSYIKTKGIKSTEQLKKELTNDINACKAWLAKKTTGSTINRKRREYTRKLEYFTSMRKLVEKYL